MKKTFTTLMLTALIGVNSLVIFGANQKVSRLESQIAELETKNQELIFVNNELNKNYKTLKAKISKGTIGLSEIKLLADELSSLSKEINNIKGQTLNLSKIEIK